MASNYISDENPPYSINDIEVLDTLIWDEDVESIDIPPLHNFDPVYEALTLGSIKNFQKPDKIGSFSNDSDTTLSTNPIEPSQNYAVNLIDQISKDLEPTDLIDSLHKQCFEAISRFSYDVDLYCDHITSTYGKFNGLVEDIVDIYSARVNVSETITSLKQLVTFLSILTTSTSYLDKRDYGTVAFVLLVSKALLKSLEAVVVISTFSKLSDYYIKFTEKAKNIIETDLNSIIKGIDLKLEYQDFKTFECCLCLDLIDFTIKQNIIENVVDKFIDKYKRCFRGSDSESADFSRRISWFRRNLPSIHEIDGQFPPNWDFIANFTNQFFNESSKDLETMLAKHKSPLVEEDLYKMVKMCKEFELEQNESQKHRRNEITIFPKYDLLEYPIISDDDIQLYYVLESERIDYSGHLTNCFEGYLGSWLYAQETNLTNSLLPFYKSDSIISKNDLNIYSSAFQLFTKFRNILNLAMSVSTEQTLLEAFQMLKRVLKLYHQLLIGQWKYGDGLDFDKLCTDGGVLVGTSMYCESTFVDMENRTCNIIRDLYQPICRKHDILDIFLAFRSSIISKVIAEITSGVDFASGYFDKISGFKSVIDNFIMDIIMSCDLMLQTTRKNFPISCYEYICNKIGRMLIKSFKDGVGSMGQISPIAMRQLSMDITLLEKYLMDLEVGETSLEAFHKYVKDEMASIIKLIK